MRLASFLLTLTLTCSAIAGEVFIPVAFRGTGAHDSVWRTEIAVSNIAPNFDAVPVLTTITFNRENLEPISFTTPLAPMEVLSATDALSTWFGVENGGGIVRVTWDDHPSARITARARIYNISNSGEYGQSVPGVRTETLVSDHFLTGLSGINGNRTNVGISNPHDRYTLFWITLYDANGQVRGDLGTYVPPRSFRQFNDIFSYFKSGPLDGATVRVTGADNVVYAYASVIRNDSGDATFVTPQ